jgi:DNA-binding transcriptional MerR regulator
MKTTDHPLWTLDELSAQVALALAEDYAGVSNGRVRDVPDRRTIRYYTTLGLLDRPGAMRGRTALYGRRHLLQLAAIKRLQARHLTLAEVQSRLLGLTDRALEKLADLPAGFVPTPSHATVKEDEPAVPARNDFWKSEPAPVTRPIQALTAVPLADGATLLIEAARPLDEHDLEALRSAAAPLMKLLHLRRIVDAGTNTSVPHEDRT